MSHRSHPLRAPRSILLGASTAPRAQAQSSCASATTRWYGQQPGESSPFPKVCLQYKHNRKRKAKCQRWWGRSKSGSGCVPGDGQPRPAQPGGQCGGGEALHPVLLSGRTEPTLCKLCLAEAIERGRREEEAARELC